MSRLMLVIICSVLVLSNAANAEFCAPYCEEDLARFNASDKSITAIEPSKTYSVSGKVLSIDKISPYAGPPRLDKCYEKYHGNSYKLVTFIKTHQAADTDKGSDINGIASQKYLSFAIADSELTYKDNPELGSIQESDSFQAKAQLSGDECLSEVWLKDLKMTSRILNKNE